MLVIGWKHKVDELGAVKALQKHAGMSLTESKKTISEAIKGHPQKLPDDFVLREDLENCNFIVR